MEIPQCDLSIAVAICQIVGEFVILDNVWIELEFRSFFFFLLLEADVTSDTVLLVAPIRMFMVITDRKLRYRAIMIFSTCIMTTIVSLVHAVDIFQSKSLPILITAVVEVRI